MIKIIQRSKLNVESQSFIEQQLCFKGVNEELLPLVRMTAPKNWRERPLLFDIPLNEYLFTSVILLFGIIPVDFHRLKMVNVHSNGFEERSKSLLMKLWNHDRTITTIKSGCEIIDVISYETRIPFIGILLEPIYVFVFKHRHKKLQQKFGLL